MHFHPRQDEKLHRVNGVIQPREATRMEDAVAFYDHDNSVYSVFVILFVSDVLVRRYFVRFVKLV